METRDWKSQLRRGVLELRIMQLLNFKPNYGYEIVSKLESFGPLASGENTVYPLLRRLKAEGTLETFTKASPTGPPRQYYRLTDQGRRKLTDLANEWEAVVRAMGQSVN